MFSMQRSRYRIHGVLILGICVLLFSALPAQITKAETTIPQEISNTISDFKDGLFQRAALANINRPNVAGAITDKLGGVQLGPVGLIKGWKPGLFNLPNNQRRYDMGAAAIGSRMFIIGGLVPDNSNVGRHTAEVWSVGVSPLDGALLNPGWQAETALPQVQGSDQGPLNTPPHDYDFTAKVSKVSSPAVTAISTDATGLNGYIYVIGGNVPVGDAADAIYTFSSYAVRIGTVTNGHITGWFDQINAHFPSLDPNDPTVISYGVQQAQLVTAKVGSVTYLYLIGGLQRRTDNFGVTKTYGLNTVFYARVGSGGKLFKPSSPGTEGWDPGPNIPVPVSTYSGIWDASAVADNFVASNQSSANAIYVIGGQLTPAQDQVAASYSENVYRALIGSNGAPTWTPLPPAQGGWLGVLPAPRSLSAAVAFNGNIYMTGGVANGGDAQDTVLTSYVEDDLKLHQFTSPPPDTLGQGTNFLQSDPEKHVLTKARKQHASVLVRADANSPNSAFLFVLGGIGAPNDSDTTDNNGANTVLYGKIGGGEDVSTTGYASDGWYYAQPFDVAQQFAQVKVQEINWSTVITSSDLDIALDYRLSLSANCASATWDAWQPLDGAATASRSVNGANSSTIAGITARCFQYRARLSTATNPLATPLLLNVSVMITVPGGPDLKLASLTAQRGINNTFLGLSVVIKNENLVDPPTLSADAEKKGSFYVDLCIFGPGFTPVAPTLPLPNPPTGTCSTVYANVNRTLLGPGVSYTIPQWRDSSTDQVVTLINYFKTPGRYNVIVLVDSLNNVNEGDSTSTKEKNNVSQAFPFDVAKTGSQISLPLLHKP